MMRKTMCMYVCTVLAFMMPIFLFLKILSPKQIIVSERNEPPDETGDGMLMNLYLSIVQKEQALVTFMKNQVPTTPYVNTKPWWDGGDECRPAEVSDSGSNKPPGGHCGHRAWDAGTGQRILSYTLYDNDDSYWNGLEANINVAKHLFPGYFVRLYTDPEPYKELLCPLLKKYEHIHVCNVKDLPTLGNIHKVHPMMWRLSPMDDPQVDVLLVRDSDSQIFEREVEAVHEWLTTGRSLHVMRDHPFHGAPIIGCCWGVRQDITRKRNAIENKTNIIGVLRKKMFELLLNKNKYMDDQNTLNEVLWPEYKDDVVRHESYKCKEFEHSQPWPTKREDEIRFVGSPWHKFQNKLPEECPVDCRPKDNQDWRYC